MSTDRSIKGIVLDEDMLTFTSPSYPEDEVEDSDSAEEATKSNDLGEFNFDKPPRITKKPSK